MDDQTLPPDNITSSPAVAQAAPEAAAATINEEEKSESPSSLMPAPSPHHHHRRSKREKYSPSRFVARPSSRDKKTDLENDDAATAADYDGDATAEIIGGEKEEVEAKEPVEENPAEMKTSSAAVAVAAVTQLLDSSTAAAAAMKSENETPLLDSGDNNDDSNTDNDDDNKKPRRRTPRAHAAPGSYVEPPDVEEDFDIDINISEDDNGDSSGKDDEDDDTINKPPSSNEVFTTTTKAAVDDDDDDNIITKEVCNDDANNTVLQISTVKKYHPKTRRTLCNVIGCEKADQMGCGGYCRRHFRLIHADAAAAAAAGQDEEEDDEEIEEESEEGEEEVEEKIDQQVNNSSNNETEDTKPRLNSTIRILTGDFAGLTGNITNIKQGGWCSLTNLKVTKPIRMSNMEVVVHNGPPPPPRYTPVKKRKQKQQKKKKRKLESVSRGRGRGSSGVVGSSVGSSGRPVRERKPPQSLLLESSSPKMSTASSSSLALSPSRPRRSTRGDVGGSSAASASSSPSGKRDSSVRRSKRGPTPSPRFHRDNNNNDNEDYDEEEQVVEVRPRGRRGRPPSASKPSPSSSTTTPVKKDCHLCKVPSCTKHRQGRCEGYCTTCFRKFKSSPTLQRGSPTRTCRAEGCTKYNQYNCEGYCTRHYREFVLEDEEEEEEEVVSPPKKRGRRAIKPEVEEEEEYVEEEEEEEDEFVADNDDDSPFDDPPRKGGIGHNRRFFCKVKLCDKWSQGTPKNGMCFKHFKIHGFGGGSKKKKKKVKSIPRSAVTKSPPQAVEAATAAAKESEGGIGVGSLVMVKERMGAGMNKPGGVGRVKKVYSDDEGVTVYDVKYILGGREKGVHANSLWLHDINAKSPMKPPPSFGGGEEDAAMLDVDEESIEDDELEGYDEFSFSQLEVPDQSVLDQRALRREEQLSALGGNNFDDDYDDHNLHLKENWKCAKCGGLNRPSATSRCTTCNSYRMEKNASEDALLERTRYELLNGNDFWICTSCVIGVPSLLMPCGRCHSSIPFVPLTMPEFEDFVRGQRKIKRKREEEIKWEWNQKLEEVSEEWGERKQKKESTSAKPKQQQVEWSKLPCKVLGCKEICAPNCEGFCEDHFRTVIVIEEPEAYPIVRPEDKQLISEYFYLTYQQFRPCVLQDWERTGKHKDKKVPRGHPGIACSHCFGREDPSMRSMGRYFPTTESSLYQQTFTGNAVKHLLECPHCPAKVQKKLVSIKEELDNVPSDGKKVSSKFVGEKGGRGKFFRRIWCRLHRLPLDEEEVQSPKKKIMKKKS